MVVSFVTSMVFLWYHKPDMPHVPEFGFLPLLFYELQKLLLISTFYPPPPHSPNTNHLIISMKDQYMLQLALMNSDTHTDSCGLQEQCSISIIASSILLMSAIGSTRVNQAMPSIQPLKRVACKTIIQITRQCVRDDHWLLHVTKLSCARLVSCPDLPT